MSSPPPPPPGPTAQVRVKNDLVVGRGFAQSLRPDRDYFGLFRFRTSQSPILSYPAPSLPGVDVLYFYSGSADRPPGDGVNEQVADPSGYAALARIRHWRRMLSNFWPAEFTLGGHTYRTVEHAFQAAKIALVDPEAAERFALESKTELAQADGALARKHRKLVLLNETQLHQWNNHKDTVMHAAMQAKFTRHEPLRAVLVATCTAQLWHGTGRGRPPTRIHDLESIRTALS